MESITVLVGTIESGRSGITNDFTRQVEFEAEKVAELRTFGTHKGSITDTRGVVETLYKAADGRLVVHVKDWSHWQGEPNTYSLYHVTEADLQSNGRFAALGAEAGYGRPLTLDEALDMERANLDDVEPESFD